MFWRRKPKPVPPVSVDEQLRQLAMCGLVPTSQEAVEFWLKDCGREQLESPPFDMILHYLGSEWEDANENWHAGSDGLWCLDTECIENAEDYVRIIERLAVMTRGDVKVTNVRADIEGRAWVAFEANGRAIKWDVVLNDNWIDPEVMQKFVTLHVECGSRRRFCAPAPNDQTVMLICPTREEFKKLNTLARYKFKLLGPGW